MTDATHDLLGIGNAIVDVIAQADDAFLEANDIIKGSMRLIDTAEAERLYGQMGPGREISGGSVANTTVGIGSFGGRSVYIGKVRDDQLGEIFRHDITAQGVSFTNASATEGPLTARSLILVTPDGERSMNTYLGACVNLTPDDVDPAVVAGASISFLEGYLMDSSSARDAFNKTAEAAHDAGRRIAMTLSDTFCVDRHRHAFRRFTRDNADILLANEDELKSLYEVDHIDAALEMARAEVEVVAVTRSEHGSVVTAAAETHIVEAAPVDRIVDLTGAGDLYAAGFLYGLARNMELAKCGHLGALAAGEVIAHYGARPETSLKGLAEAAGLL
ncbi:Fructokinase [hydrothermal vent metagenome]|uniref:Fructokinase n=1 Tax=hydrothermal vent metagenome TaxID=652676 RepID=A0A3B0TDW5_9ZZZZ